MNDLRISGKSNRPRNESDIRLNYNDPNKLLAASNHVIAGFNHFRLAAFYSLDGGSSWKAAEPAYLPLVSDDLFQADPNVDWTSDGTAWALCCAFDTSGGNRRLRSYRSLDAGKTWSHEATPSGSHLDADRPILWVDHGKNSPYKDRIYATWEHAGAWWFTRRTSAFGGAWHPPVQLSAGETTFGSVGDIKTNRRGDVFVLWYDTGGSHNIFVRKSTNGGAQFGDPVVVATTFASGQKLDIPAASGLDGRAKVYVSAGAYRVLPKRGTKQKAKNLAYAVWSDLSGAAGCDSGHGPGDNAASLCKTRVWFTRSTNGGANWAAPVMLNDQDALNDQFHSRLCVDEKTGTLLVVYRDTINDPSRRKTDVWVQVSDDDGETWSDAVQVNSAPTDETTAGSDAMTQYGDYDGLTGFDGRFFPSWTDRRGGGKGDREEIWTIGLSLPLGFNWKKYLGQQKAIDPVARALGDVLPPERKGPPIPPEGPYQITDRHVKLLKRLSPIQRAYAMCGLKRLGRLAEDLRKQLAETSQPSIARRDSVDARGSVGTGVRRRSAAQSIDSAARIPAASTRRRSPRR